MRLSKFILSNLEEILSEWEAFARTILPEKKFDSTALRDHAAEILATIAEDMETPQTALQQGEKSKGRGQKTAKDSSAETHSVARLGQGFNQVQSLSEFRALRATVIRLWMDSLPEVDQSAMYQMIRFNEAIDQALSESAARFMEQIEKSRDFAIAVLAHDLRNPVNAIVSSAQVLQVTRQPIERAMVSEVANNIIVSGMQMSKLIDTLLDFTRTRLGQPLPVKHVEADFASICRQIVSELNNVHPEHSIELSCPESLRGRFDPTRISQMLSNLIGNAIEHGATSRPTSVTAILESDHINLQVHNDGEPMSESALLTLFDFALPQRKEDRGSMNDFNHLGIGLFIVKKIVEAHSGTISVTSTPESGTTFLVSLPCSMSGSELV